MASKSAMAASERLALLVYFPDLGRALDAADRLVDQIETFRRIEQRHAEGKVDVPDYRNAEGRLREAIADSRAANQIWRDARRGTM